MYLLPMYFGKVAPNGAPFWNILEDFKPTGQTLDSKALSRRKTLLPQAKTDVAKL